MGYTGIFHKMSYSLWPFASCSKRRRNWNDMLFQKPFCGSRCLSEGFRRMGPMPKCVWLPPAEDLPTNLELKNSSVVDNELAFHTQWQSGWCSWTCDKWRVPFEMSLHNNGDRLSSSAVSLFSVPSLRSKSCTDFYFLEKKKNSCSEFCISFVSITKWLGSRQRHSFNGFNAGNSGQENGGEKRLE